MITEVTGPWNRELIDTWAAHCLAPARELAAGGPYVGIAVVRESMLCPPDAIEALRKVAQYAAARLQCRGFVVVAGPEVEGRDFLAPTFARIYAGVVAHQIFDALEPAMAWSLALLAAPDAGAAPGPT